MLAEIVGPGDEQQHWLLELTAHFSLAAGKKKVGAIKSLQHSAEVEDLVESFLAALKSLQDSAEVVAGEIEGHEFGYEHPRMLFFNQIAVWWFNMGGPFAASRNIKTGAPDGPFVRFLQAVIGPVMGTDAPTPEGIYKIIHREKKQLIQFGFAFDKDGRAVVDDQGIAVRS